jgi:hypothetical protein
VMDDKTRKTENRIKLQGSIVYVVLLAFFITLLYVLMK